MNTIYDIAQKAGVSPSTVSKVINNYAAIPEATKNRIRQVIKEMNYIPNVSARSLSRGTSRNIGILAFFGMGISPFKHTLFTEILDSFQKTMNTQNFDLLFVSHNVADEDGSFLKNVISRDVAAVLIFGEFNNTEIDEVIRYDIPKVGFDYLGNQMTAVGSDNYEKMKLMTKYLIDLGHRNIVFIHGENVGITPRRILGFTDALREAGIPCTDSMLIPTRYLNVDAVKNITYRLLSSANPPTAIMYPDDYSAIEALSAIKEAGLRCPEDISITGFDGLGVGQLVSPKLTSVHQNTEAIGKALAESLISQLSDDKSTITQIQVPSEFYPGTSSGPVKKKD
jgi:LacI family transcriptional regulator